MSRQRQRKHETQPSEPKSSRSISPKHRRWFILICLTSPFAFLLLLESGLRLAGFGGVPATVRRVGDTAGGDLWITDSVGAASFFDSRQTKPGTLDQHAFFEPKSPNTIRIVLAGGSAIKGFPQPMGFSAAAFLEEMLEDAWPDRDVEVINLGTTAIASFPVLEMMTEMLEHDPDLVIIYSGHNEYFGAYGVASLHYAARTPLGIKLRRWYSATGFANWVRNLSSRSPSPGIQAGQTLMEAVVGSSRIRPDSPLRDAASRNLEAHIGEMAARCNERQIPAIVCTLASLERGLAPIGEPDQQWYPAEARPSIDDAMAADNSSEGDLVARIERLNRALSTATTHAGLHYALAEALTAQGDVEAARGHYQAALDDDPMPWRAPSASIDAIRRAAQAEGAILCDVQEAFRRASPGGIIGWDLLEDHVHLSMKGQALLARTLVETLTHVEGRLHVPPEAYARLADFETYADRLGANPYDRFSVVEQLCRVFGVPFMRSSNAPALARFERQRRELLSAMPASARQEAERWTKPETHQNIRIPLSGMATHALLREGRVAEAERLFRAAQHHVPTFCGFHFEYAFFALSCRQNLNGRLSESDQAIARKTIEEIKIFLDLADQTSGQPERYIGRLHQLLGEYAEAIPYLRTSREKVEGTDVVAVDAALFESLVKTGDLSGAQEIITSGIARGGPTAELYRRMRDAIGGSN